MEAICEEEGYFEPLGNKHWAFFADEGSTLLVTFQTLQSVRGGHPSQMPLSVQWFGDKGYSHLCIIADGETWYRDPKVYRYFDRLVDDAFFEDFDRVVFYGAGMGAYAACAFSVCAPGATVLAVEPRATLDPAVAGWDRRHFAMRKLDFTDRYGYAPDMVEGTGEVFTIHDPAIAEDAMHAALFTKPFVTQLRTPYLGTPVDAALTQMQILPKLIGAACEGQMSKALFHRLMRQRRAFGPYLKTMLALTESRGKPKRALWICRSVNARLNAPRFRRRQAELEAELAKG